MTLVCFHVVVLLQCCFVLGSSCYVTLMFLCLDDSVMSCFVMLPCCGCGYHYALLLFACMGEAVLLLCCANVPCWCYVAMLLFCYHVVVLWHMLLFRCIFVMLQYYCDGGLCLFCWHVVGRLTYCCYVAMLLFYRRVHVMLCCWSIAGLLFCCNVFVILSSLLFYCCYADMWHFCYHIVYVALVLLCCHVVVFMFLGDGILMFWCVIVIMLLGCIVVVQMRRCCDVVICVLCSPFIVMVPCCWYANLPMFYYHVVVLLCSCC